MTSDPTPEPTTGTPADLPSVAEPAPAPAAPRPGNAAPSAGPAPGRRVPPPPPPPGRSPLPPPGGPARPAVSVGRVVEVTVAGVAGREVEVRLADGRTGVVARNEFEHPPAVGDVVVAALLARDDPRGRVVLSHEWARKQRAWDRVEAAHDGRTTLTGLVTKVVKGGAVVDLGVRAFLPTSMVGEQPGADPAVLVGTEVEVLVTEADRAAERLVVSRRDVLRRQRRDAERDAYARLEVGRVVPGTVVSVADYGAVVDLGGVRGLVHRSELTWGRLESVESVVAVGGTVEVRVLEVNRSKRRVSLSLRQAQTDPYAEVAEGEVRSGTVTRVVEYGCFVRLDGSEAEGLVHLSELSDLRDHRPDQLVSPGEPLVVKVLSVDRARRRMALSVTRVLLDG